VKPGTEDSFARCSLQRTSYARPGKLFTASEALIARSVGDLRPDAADRVREAVIRLLRG
jgi:mRNA interferase MazF